MHSSFSICLLIIGYCSTADQIAKSVHRHVIYCCHGSPLISDYYMLSEIFSWNGARYGFLLTLKYVMIHSNPNRKAGFYMAQTNTKTVRRKRKVRLLTRNGQYYDYNLLACVVLLTCFGLIMLYSTSAYDAQVEYGSDTYFLFRQALFSVCLLYTSPSPRD